MRGPAHPGAHRIAVSPKHTPQRLHVETTSPVPAGRKSHRRSSRTDKRADQNTGILNRLLHHKVNCGTDTQQAPSAALDVGRVTERTSCQTDAAEEDFCNALGRATAPPVSAGALARTVVSSWRNPWSFRWPGGEGLPRVVQDETYIRRLKIDTNGKRVQRLIRRRSGSQSHRIRNFLRRAHLHTRVPHLQRAIGSAGNVDIQLLNPCRNHYTQASTSILIYPHVDELLGTFNDPPSVVKRDEVDGRRKGPSTSCSCRAVRPAAGVRL